MIHRTMLLSGFLLIGQGSALVGQPDQPSIEVYKSATCGC